MTRATPAPSPTSTERTPPTSKQHDAPPARQPRTTGRTARPTPKPEPAPEAPPSRAPDVKLPSPDEAAKDPTVQAAVRVFDGEVTRVYPRRSDG